MQFQVCCIILETSVPRSSLLSFIQSEYSGGVIRNVFTRFPGCIRAETPGNGAQFPPLSRVRFRPLKKPLIYKSSRTKQRTALDVRAREGRKKRGGGEGAYGCYSNLTSTD